MWQRAGIVLRLRRDLGEGDVACRFDELPELAVCDRGPVDPEPVDRDTVDRGFLGIMLVRPHAERAARNHDHVAASRLRGGGAALCQCAVRTHDTRLPPAYPHPYRSLGRPDHADRCCLRVQAAHSEPPAMTGVKLDYSFARSRPGCL